VSRPTIRVVPKRTNLFQEVVEIIQAAAMQGLQGPDAPLARQTLKYLAARHGQSSVVALLDRR
jgi:hypothetical protein